MRDEYQKLIETLVKLHVKSHLNEEYLLESKNLRNAAFLFEANGIDAADIKSQTASVKKKLLNALKLFPADKADKLIAQLNKLIIAIPDGAKISSIISSSEFSNDDESQKLAKNYDKSVMLATNGMASVINALGKISKALTPYIDELSDDELSMTIGELSKKAKTDSGFKDKFIEPARLESGMAKIFVPGEDAKNSFRRGAIAAAKSAGSAGAKSKLGQLFQKAASFLGGYFTAPAAKMYPQLYVAFKQFLLASTPSEISNLSRQIEIKKGNIVYADAAAASASVAAAAGGGTVTSKSENIPEDKKEDKKKTNDATIESRNSIRKAIMQHITQLVGKKGVPAKVRKTLVSSIDRVSNELAGQSANEPKKALEKWWNGLGPKTLKLLCGSTDPKKVLQTIMKSVDDVMKVKSNVKEHVRSPNNELIVERWQRLAGIK